MQCSMHTNSPVCLLSECIRTSLHLCDFYQAILDLFAFLLMTVGVGVLSNRLILVVKEDSLVSVVQCISHLPVYPV